MIAPEPVSLKLVELRSTTADAVTAWLITSALPVRAIPPLRALMALPMVKTPELDKLTPVPFAITPDKR